MKNIEKIKELVEKMLPSSVSANQQVIDVYTDAIMEIMEKEYERGIDDATKQAIEQINKHKK